MGQAFTLLNPGPINVSENVRRALADSEDQCHREVEYLEMQTRVREKLARAFGVEDTHDAVLISGSGTAGMEMMVCSAAGDGVLVLDNGVYGDRLKQMAEVHGIRCKVLRLPWTERPEPEAIEAALEDGIDTIALVHHETTVGLLNDVPAIAEVARRTGRRLVVDSVSGLGGEAFDFDAIQPTAVCCTANKCIQGLPGVSFVFVQKGAELRKRSVYFDMANQLAKQAAGGTPFTPAIQVTAAFETALDELIEETVAGRQARYARAAGILRGILGQSGLDLLLPDGLLSNTITCAKLPEGVTYQTLHAHLRSQGYVIYAGQGDLQESVWRVCNMGLIPDERLHGFADALAGVHA